LVSKRTAMALLIAGGAFYIVGGLAAGTILAALVAFGSGLAGTSGTTQENAALATFFGWGLFTGIPIIIGGILVNSTSSKLRKIGGALAIVMALVGIINTIAGLIIGFVLTLVGSIVGFTYKEPEVAQPTPTTEKIKVRCPACANLNEETAQFCQGCGAKLR
jgi:hypothetical protein